MGYLDKQSRVVDFILTERGRKLFATGELEFTYFALLDDGLDYDPWSTGSLSDSDREYQVENQPMLEAPFIRDVRAGVGPMEPTAHLFTAASSYVSVPHVSVPTNLSLTASCDQRVKDGVYSRSASSLATVDVGLTGDTEQTDPGFIVRVYASSSAGLNPLDLRQDLSGRRSYDSFIAVSIDAEVPIDSPRVGDPAASRSSVSVVPASVNRVGNK